MISSVGKLATMGLVGGTVAGTAVAKPKTQKGEHNFNKFQTAVGLGALTATPFLVNEVVKANPAAATKFATNTGVAIEKGSEYAVKYGKKAFEYAKKAANSETGKKVVSFVQKVVNKAKNTKIGQTILNKINQVGSTKIKGKPVEILVDVATNLRKFIEAPAAKKGKIALIAAGVALVTYGVLKKITDYYKKEGAIDQKYDDLHKKYERMMKIDPITNAQTGEPISFEEYCKLAQTMVK